MKLALFDFDGTITKNDSMLGFTKFAVGKSRYFLGLLVLSPVFAALSLKVISNTRAKEYWLKYYFSGWDIERLNLAGSEYSRSCIDKIVRKAALNQLLWHQSQGHQIVIVSASLENWLQDWCLRHGYTLLATQLDVQQGKVSGKLASPNCYGQEKVRRIKQAFDLGEVDYIYAYGDSAGDKQMLAEADDSYYRFFE